MGVRKATIATCDNPECDNEAETSRDDPAPGYYLGKGYWVLGGGGPIPATYACSVECIAKAVQGQIDRALR